MSFPQKIDGFGTRLNTTTGKFDTHNSGVEARATFITGFVYCDYQVTAGITIAAGSAMCLETKTGSDFETASGVNAIDTDHPIGVLFRKSGAATDGTTAVATDIAMFAGILDAEVTVAAGKYAKCVIQVTGLRTDVTISSSAALGAPLIGADDATHEGKLEVLVDGGSGVVCPTAAIAVGTGTGADVYLLNPLNL